jgi:hypothetical protein
MALEGIELYKSIDALPIGRYQLFQLCLLQDSGIGSTMGDVVEHMSKIDHYITHGLYDHALTERRNLQLNFFSITEKLNYSHLAFACLVKKIDGETIEVDSEGDAEEIVKRLSKRVSHQESQDEIKKKRELFEQEMMLYFPKRYSSVQTSDIEHFSIVKAYLANEFKYLAQEIEYAEYSDNTKKIFLNKKVSLLDNSRDSQVIFVERSFEKMLLSVQKEYPSVSRRTTTKQFYAALELIDERIKKQESNGRKNRI